MRVKSWKIAESVLRADSTLYPTLVVPNLLPFQSVCNQAREAARINLCVTERRDIAHRWPTHRLTSQAIDAEEPFGHDTKRRGVKRGIHQTYFFSLWISELCYMRWRWVFGFIQFVWIFCSRGKITNSSSICSYYFDKSQVLLLIARSGKRPMQWIWSRILHCKRSPFHKISSGWLSWIEKMS